MSRAPLQEDGMQTVIAIINNMVEWKTLSLTEYIMYKKDSIPLNGYSEDNRSHQSNVNNHLFFEKSISADNLSFTTITDPIDDAIERELLSYKIFKQLGTKYEEMRRILIMDLNLNHLEIYCLATLYP